MKNNPERFIRANTGIKPASSDLAIRLHLADEAHALWAKTQAELDDIGLPPPFWAFAWAGGLGLARHIIDHPDLVRAKRVADFAAGSGLLAIAAAKSGAAHVQAHDIDPWAATAIRLNAALNGVTIDFLSGDAIGTKLDVDVLLAGDVFYDQAFAERLTCWFSNLTAAGVLVLIGDPGRSYCPRTRMQALARYEIPVSRALEDGDVKTTTIWRFTAG